jgi:hypothetical protein
MRWSEFQQASDVAKLARERNMRRGVALLGTLRTDGSPRISAIEPAISLGELLLGMMGRAKKALDLIHDPLCGIHGAITNLDGSDGEAKLYARAVERQESDAGARRHRVFRERWGASAPEAFHVFTVEIESAAYIAFDLGKSEMIVTQWDARRGVRETSRAYPQRVE